MCEFDAKLSADGEVVLMHDDTLLRTAGVNAAVFETAFADLARLDAGRWHSPHYAGEAIPTLERAAHWLIANQCFANIEIKPCPGREAETGRLVAQAADQLWQSGAPPLLSSFSGEALAAAQLVAPGLPRAHLFEALPDDWQSTLNRLACCAAVLNYRNLSLDIALKIRAAGYRLLVYTCNNAELLPHLWEWGVDTIITDDMSFSGRFSSAQPATLL